MKKIEDILDKMDCSSDVKKIVLLTLNEVRKNPDKPESSQIQNTIHNELVEITKDED